MSITVVEAPVNKVVRRYAIRPGTVQGRRITADFELALRYTEADALLLERDSELAYTEVLELARRRGMLPKDATADVVCVQETLRRAS